MVDYIRTHSLSADTIDHSRIDPYGLKRNSLANISHWKTRLTSAEIDRIKLQVQEISTNFYSDQDW